MVLDIYQNQIVSLFQMQYAFEKNDLIAFDILKTISNKQEDVNVLNDFLHRGEAESIRTYHASLESKTYDDFTYILLALEEKSFLICVWDSDELNDYPIILHWRLLKK